MKGFNQTPEATVESLTASIKNFKNGKTMKVIKSENVKLYYHIKGLSSKLSKLKSIEKEQFIAKNHLIEYKGLIIWILNNKCNYRGYLNLKEAMTSLLSKIEAENIPYTTSRGVKGIITRLTLSVGLDNCEMRLREANGLDVTALTNGNYILESFQQFRLNALM